MTPRLFVSGAEKIEDTWPGSVAGTCSAPVNNGKPEDRIVYSPSAPGQHACRLALRTHGQRTLRIVSRKAERLVFSAHCVPNGKAAVLVPCRGAFADCRRGFALTTGDGEPVAVFRQRCPAEDWPDWRFALNAIAGLTLLEADGPDDGRDLPLISLHRGGPEFDKNADCEGWINPLVVGYRGSATIGDLKADMDAPENDPLSKLDREIRKATEIREAAGEERRPPWWVVPFLGDDELRRAVGWAAALRARREHRVSNKRPDSPAGPDSPTGLDSPAGPDSPAEPDSPTGLDSPAGPDSPAEPDSLLAGLFGSGRNLAELAALDSFGGAFRGARRAAGAAPAGSEWRWRPPPKLDPGHDQLARHLARRLGMAVEPESGPLDGDCWKWRRKEWPSRRVMQRLPRASAVIAAMAAAGDLGPDTPTLKALAQTLRSLAEACELDDDYANRLSKPLCRAVIHSRPAGDRLIDGREAFSIVVEKFLTPRSPIAVDAADPTLLTLRNIDRGAFERCWANRWIDLYASPGAGPAATVREFVRASRPVERCATGANGWYGVFWRHCVAGRDDVCFVLKARPFELDRSRLDDAVLD